MFTLQKFFLIFQNLERKFKEHDVDEEFRDILEKLCRIPLLSPEIIPVAVEAIRRLVTSKNDPRLTAFFFYFVNQWDQEEMLAYYHWLRCTRFQWYIRTDPGICAAGVDDELVCVKGFPSILKTE